MRILLTGAGGFLGGHVLREAARRGIAVDVVLRPGAAVPARADRVHFADLADDTALAALDGHLHRVDAVVHLAGRVVRGTDVASCRAALAGVVGTTLPLLERLAAAGFSGRVVVATSAAKFGTAARDGPLGDDAPCRPVDAYGFAKAELARLLGLLAERNVLRLVEAVPFNIVGAGQPAALVPAAFAARIAALPAGGGTIEVGPTGAVRDFLAAEDAADALLLLAAAGESGRAYNLASGRGVRIAELLEGLRRLSAVPFAWAEAPARRTAWDIESVVGRADGLRALGWRPRHTLGDALTASLADAGVPLRETRRPFETDQPCETDGQPGETDGETRRHAT